MQWYQQDVKDVLKQLNTTEKGLSNKEAEKRLQKYGKNTIGKEKKIPVIKLILSQFNDPLVWVLILATIVSAVIGEIIDASIIGVILILNASFGFFQEYKAERAIELLRKLRQYNATVIRNGEPTSIDTNDLVPGDIVVIEEGDRIPADCRIIEAIECKIDEASLTGESQPVRKTVSLIRKQSIIADQTNMLFAGTTCMTGKARAIIVATGHKTELGKIAKEIEAIEVEPTPLQKRLKEVGKWLTISIVGISFLVFILGILRGFAIADMFLTSISLAVAAVPEGLPAVVTVTLALGVRRMLKRNALIRKLRSVETLGSVTVICADKTGTMTKNEMTVTKVYANDEEYVVTGSGFEPKGDILLNGNKATDRIKPLVTIATSCNNATLEIGDPTERALKVLAAKAGVQSKERVTEVPFSSDRKYMSVTDKEGMVYVKGALEVVLAMCTSIESNGQRRKITDADKKKIIDKNEELTSQALRVLAFAYGKNDIAFVGLAGMIDPPRTEVKKAIKLCKQAGIRPVMITGDHILTAKAIAKQVGIVGDALSGEDMEKMEERELRDRVKKVSIFARVTSLHKARILKALQQNGEIVAMTGDGVNDAPALKQANVGVSMNIKGSEVAKDVSHLILLDDNFATIVAAVEEGRVIYNNIKKFVKYLLAANFGEVTIILTSVLVGIPLPLVPVQILWINLVTDGLPALALGLDPPETNVMQRKPRNPKESFFRNTKMFMVYSTILSAAVVLGLFWWYYTKTDLSTARTVAFTALILFELFLVFACRSSHISLLRLQQNWYLYGAVAISVLLQLVLLYTPLAAFFNLTPLSLRDWLIIIPISAIGLLFFEGKKIIHKEAS